MISALLITANGLFPSLREKDSLMSLEGNNCRKVLPLTLFLTLTAKESKSEQQSHAPVHSHRSSRQLLLPLLWWIPVEADRELCSMLILKAHIQTIVFPDSDSPSLTTEYRHLPRSHRRRPPLPVHPHLRARLHPEFRFRRISDRVPRRLPCRRL